MILQISWLIYPNAVRFARLYSSLPEETFFLHSLMSSKNDVVSSVMAIFVHTKEYIKAYDFVNVKPCDQNY